MPSKESKETRAKDQMLVISAMTIRYNRAKSQQGACGLWLLDAFQDVGASQRRASFHARM